MKILSRVEKITPSTCGISTATTYASRSKTSGGIQMSDDFKTPCCGYDTSRDERTKSVIMWNPYNRVVSCHNCGTTYIALDDDVISELILLATDDQMREAHRRAGKDISEAAEKTRKILLDAVEQFKDRELLDSREEKI